MEFKDKIKKLRTEKGLSLTQLGALLGKTESACRAWELGRTKPDSDTLVWLCQHFDCSADYLLGLSDARHPENTRIVDELELTDESIESIKAFIDTRDSRFDAIDVLNTILPSESFCYILMGLAVFAKEQEAVFLTEKVKKLREDNKKEHSSNSETKENWIEEGDDGFRRFEEQRFRIMGVIHGNVSALIEMVQKTAMQKLKEEMSLGDGTEEAEQETEKEKKSSPQAES